MRVDGETAGVAHDWVNGVIGGFKEASTQNHVAVDDRWFTITDSGLTSTLEIRLPLDAITAAVKR